MQSTGFAYLLLVLIGLAWGFTPTLTRMSALAPTALSADRALLCAIVLSLYLAIARRRVKISREIVVAGVWGAISTSLYCYAATVSSPARVYGLYYLYPVIGLGLDWLRTRKIQGGEIVVGVLALLGVVVMTPGKSGGVAGDLAALGSAFAWLAFSEAARALKEESDAVFAAALGQGVLAAVLLPLAAAFGETFVPETNAARVSLAVFGLISSIPLLLWGYAVKKIKTSTAGVVAMLEAPLGMLIAWMLLGIVSTDREIVGSLVILTASATTIWRGRK